MCRLFYQESIIKGFKEKRDFIIPKVLISESKAIGNGDGFFLASSKRNSIRTLSYGEYLNNIEKILKDSSWYIAHLRNATNSISRDHIHGWTFNYNGKEYYTAHNGIFRKNIQDRREFENDSLQFFYNLFETKGKTLVEKIKKYVKTQNGNGIAFIISKDGTEKYFFSVNDKMYLQEVITDDDKYFIVSSKSDILEVIQKDLEVSLRDIQEDYIYNIRFDFIKEEIITLDFIKDVSEIKEFEDSLIYTLDNKEYNYSKLEIKGYKYGGYTKYYNDNDESYGYLKYN